MNVCFVCYGNTCRSPMAQYIFQYLVDNYKLTSKFNIMSAGTNAFTRKNISKYTRQQLILHNIPFNNHLSVHFNKDIYDKNDYIFIMDDFINKNIKKIVTDNNKIYKLLAFTDDSFLNENNIYNKNVNDPYGTTDYSHTYKIIYQGCNDILNYLIREHNLLATR